MITKVDNSIENLKNLWIEIFLDSTNKVSNIADGSVLNATAFGTAKVAQKAIKDIAITEAKLFPDTATGEYLDKCAALYGVSPRRGALGSSTYIRVYAAPGTVYGEDTIFVNKNGIRFQVDQSLTVGVSGYGYVGVRSINAGYVTNVAPNSITTVTPQPIGHIECTNEYYAVGGRDSEDDETFRVRIKNNLNVLSKGTIEYYTQIFQNLDDRILKVMNVGLDENGKFVLYIVSQNGIYFLDSELEEILEQAKNYFGLFELNLDGNVSGIVLKNAEWFFVGGERGLDFRLDIDPEYDTTTVRKNIQVALTKYLDFRFWTSGKVIEWDDLLDIVKKAEGVKYVPDQYFFPYYDEQVPINQLPRIKGFVMRDAAGNILFDNTVDLSPMFYPQESDDIFRGLSDNALSLSQQVYFTLVDEKGNPVEGARISVGANSVITNSLGQATLFLANGTYGYVITKQYYETLSGSFVVLNASISVSNTLTLAPWTATFTVKDENGNPLEGAILSAGGKQASTNINGVATLNLQNGTYPYIISKLGYEEISGKSFTISNANIEISETLYFYAWDITFVVLGASDSSPLSGVTVSINKNSYLTNGAGIVTVPLINGNYNVSLKKVGYQDTVKNITVLNQDDTATYTMELFEYNVKTTITQEDGKTPIPGATFAIKNTPISGVTDANGQFSFKLVNGSYNYTATKKEFDDLSGGFNVNNNDLELSAKMSFRHFEVNIVVIDEDGYPVSSALVSINNKVITTDVTGEAVVSLQNGTYPYTITKIGYNNYTGSIVVADADQSVVANMVFYLWSVLFKVTGKEGIALQNAELSINGSNYQTDQKGEVSLYLRNNVYPYSISFLGYDNYTGDLDVDNQAVLMNVQMQQKKYPVTFAVTGRNGIALSGATVTVGSETAKTSDGGIAVLNLVNGTYDYTVTQPGYVVFAGNFTVNNAALPVSVGMTPVSFEVIFKVTDDNATPNPLANVEIAIDGQTLSTNNQGQVSLRIWGGEYPVIYTLAGYVTVTTNITISKNETLDQILKKIWKLSFLAVAATREPLVGATIKVSGSGLVNGATTLTTKADGTTDQVDITNGQYSYSASLEGYSPEEGTGVIQDANKVQDVDLAFGFETIFLVKDNNNTPVSGVSVVIDGITTLTTAADGTVKLNLSNGQHTYSYSKNGFVSGSGDVTVSGATQTVNISMTPGGVVTFSVTSQGNPVSGVAITVQQPASRALPQTITTNGQGVATVELPNGSYQYTTSISGYKNKPATSFAVNGANLPLPVDLTNFKYYTITVNTKLGGSNLDGVTVSLIEPSLWSVVEQGTTVNGTYVFTKVTNKSYEVMAAKDKYWVATSTVPAVVQNANVVKNFTFAQVSEATFTFKDSSDNTPIQNVKVTLTDTSDSTKQYEGLSSTTGIATLFAKNTAIQPKKGILYGTYNYVIEAPEPYLGTTGSVTINSETFNKEVLLIGNYDVTFNVKGKKKKEFVFRPEVGDFVYGDKTWSRALNPNKTCVGIITDVGSRSFDFIALEEYERLSWVNKSSISLLPLDIWASVNAAGALIDFKGKHNTDEIISKIGSANAPAAAACANYTATGFIEGSWFLPALGQLNQLYLYYTKINQSLAEANGTQIETGATYWATTLVQNTASSNIWGIKIVSTSSVEYPNPERTGTTVSNVAIRTRPFCTYEYNPVPNGVYIYDKHGDCFTKEEWTAQNKLAADAMGVGVVTNDTQFVISPAENSSNLSWGGFGTTINNIATTADETTAKLDYLGSGNTDKIIAQLGVGNAPAAEYCQSVVFANGQKGYLPALGQWQTAYDNKAEIDACMSLIGGTAIYTSAYHWTSTQYSPNYSWILNWSGGSVGSNTKNYNYRVRAFTMLPFKGETHRGTYILGTDNNLYTKEEWPIVYKDSFELLDFINVAAPKWSIGAPSINPEYIPVYISKNLNKDLIKSFVSTDDSRKNAVITFTKPVDVKYTSKVYDGSYRVYNAGIVTELNIPGTEISDEYHLSIDGEGILPVGVAVASPETQFVIAPTGSTSNLQWGGSGTIINNIVTTTNAATAKLDFKGKYNTEQIISQLGAGNAPASDYCQGVTFANGQKGYLPALGQWQTAYNNKAEVNACISLIGGADIYTDIYHWASTQNSSTNSWILYWEDGTVTPAIKSDIRRVRVFADLVAYETAPLQNAIIIPDGDISKKATTNAQGQAILSLKAAIDHPYTVEAEGYVPRTGTTGVLTGPITIDWTLEGSIRTTFVVKANTESGVAIGNASIHVVSSEGALIPIDITKVTDSTGTAVFDLAAETYNITITAEGYSFDTSYTITVKEDTPSTTTIVGLGLYNINFTVNRVNTPVANKIVDLKGGRDAVPGNSPLLSVLSEMGRVLFKRTGDKTGTFIRLDPNDSTKYFDGSPAMLDGTEGDVMVYMPEFYYLWEEGLLGFSYRIARNKLTDNYIHMPASLLGAYKAKMLDGKIYSVSGYDMGSNPTNANHASYTSAATARGTGYQAIDYHQHCQIAMLFCAKYQTRDSKTVLGKGTAYTSTTRTTGTTNSLGNRDTQNENTTWNSFQGIEGVFGGVWEAVSGITPKSSSWAINMLDGSVRTVAVAPLSNMGYITAMALETGPYFDMIPTTNSGGSSTTYYCDYYNRSSNATVVFRSGTAADVRNGVFYTYPTTTSITGGSVGSRLSFRGTLTESKDVAAFKAITAV